MCESGEIIRGNSSEITQNLRGRRFLNLLLAGILLFAPSSNPAKQTDPGNEIENKAYREPRPDMFKGIKIVPDSESKKIKKNKESEKKQQMMEKCDDCQVA
jgi:hypothetical protein